MNRPVLGFTLCFVLVSPALGKPNFTIEAEALLGTFYLRDASAAQRWSEIIKIEKTEKGIQVLENHRRSMERVGVVDSIAVFRHSDVTVGPYPAKLEGNCLFYKKEDNSVVVFSIIFEGGQIKGLMPKTEEKGQDLSCTFLNCYLKQ